MIRREREAFGRLTAQLKQAGKISDDSELVWDGLSKPTEAQVHWSLCQSAVTKAEPIVRANEKRRRESEFKKVFLD